MKHDDNIDEKDLGSGKNTEPQGDESKSKGTGRVLIYEGGNELN